MPKWHHPDINSGDARESRTTRKFKVYATSRSKAILLLCGLDYKPGMHIFLMFGSPDLHTFIHFQPVFEPFASYSHAFSDFFASVQTFWWNASGIPA